MGSAPPIPAEQASGSAATGDVIEESELNPRFRPPDEENYVHPILGIAMTREELQRLLPVAREYRKELAALTQELSGDELAAAVEEMSERYIARYEEILGEERTRIFAETTREYVMGTELPEHITDEEWQKVEEISGE